MYILYKTKFINHFSISILKFSIKIILSKLKSANLCITKLSY